MLSACLCLSVSLMQCTNLSLFSHFISLPSSTCPACFYTTHTILGRASIHAVRGLSFFPSACKPHNGSLPYPAPPSLPCLQQHPAHSRSSVKTHGIILWMKKQERLPSTRRKNPNSQFPQFPAVALCVGLSCSLSSTWMFDVVLFVFKVVLKGFHQQPVNPPPPPRVH